MSVTTDVSQVAIQNVAPVVRLLNFGPNRSLSDIDGNMIIDGK